MIRFVLNTRSESGDSYSYFIEHPKQPTTKQLQRFLLKHSHDKDEDGKTYENIESVHVIEKFLKIPKK